MSGGRIPPVLIRRVNRVRSRWEDDATEDEMLDDIFVLWRAFEATFPLGAKQWQRATAAVPEVVDTFGITALPAVLKWAWELRLFEQASNTSLGQWFGGDSSGVPLTQAQAEEVIRRIEQITDAARSPTKWRRSHSTELARVLYDVRCAVFHSSLETSNTLAPKILPLLHQALVELVIARGAVLAGLPLDAARQAFNAPRPREG